MTASGPFASEAFDELLHEVAGFDCGVTPLNEWLRQHAVVAARARVARTFVWVPSRSRRVVAYYALCAHAVPRTETPSRIGRGVPDPVPAALIAKLALDRALAGQGLGGVLLADACRRILAASESGPAVRAIVVDASTPAGRALYQRFGFVEVPGRADRMIIRAETVARALGA